MSARSAWYFAVIYASLFPWAYVCPGDTGKSDGITLVRLGGIRPVFIALKITLDQRPITESRAEQTLELFQMLDTNSDRVLDESELSELSRHGAPAFTTTHRAGWWRTADRITADGKISPDEFEILTATILGSPIQIQFLPPRQSQTFDLIGKLDRNLDGKSSFEEIREGNRSLLKYDLNEDGSIAVEELVPPGISPESINSSSTRGRIWLLSTAETRSSSSASLLKELDRGAEGVFDQKLSATELGFSEEQLSHYDVNQDLHLDESELESMLASPPIDLKGDLRIRTNSFRRPNLKMESRNAEIVLSSTGSTNLTRITGVQVQWSSRGTLITHDDARRFFRQRFIQTDSDKNDYLSEQEYAMLGIPGTSFNTVDRNQDGMVVVEELLFYLRLQMLLTQGRVVLICADETRSLFELLDQDSDYRLSEREFHEGQEKLSRIDSNGDRAISAVELTEQQSVVVEYNRSSLLEFAARSSIQAPLRSRIRENLSGPLWFQKMDRNRDGYLTRKEFLGRIETFVQFDRDGDGVIDEAESNVSVAGN